MTVTILTGPGCGGCISLTSTLRLRGVAHSTQPVNAPESASVIEAVEGKMGGPAMGLPVTLVTDASGSPVLAESGFHADLADRIESAVAGKVAVAA